MILFSFSVSDQISELSSTNMQHCLAYGIHDVSLDKACGSTHQHGPEKEDRDSCG